MNGRLGAMRGEAGELTANTFHCNDLRHSLLDVMSPVQSCPTAVSVLP